MILAYHFVGAALRNGSAIPADGEWLEVKPPLIVCQHGLHWSRDPFDALQYAPGATLCKVEADGELIEQDDKGCSTRRRIVARIDATEMLWSMARWSALQVIHLWDAPPVVRKFLETGDESLRVASWAASREASWEVSWAASREASWAASLAASRVASLVASWEVSREVSRVASWVASWEVSLDQRKEFNRRVIEAFPKEIA